MRIRELGEKSRLVKEQIASALKNWEPRQNKPIKIIDVGPDIQTNQAGTLQIVVKTRDRKRWIIRIDHGTFVDATLC